MHPMDPYARITHTRHWLSSAPKKTKQPRQSSLNKEIVINKPPHVKKQRQRFDKFNAEVMDTFCCHWPDMHSYVLVRVLERTIAIMPVRSRLAFLYFHHASLPTHPSPQELRKALQPAVTNPSSKRIQDMFKSWKHTLAFEEQQQKEEDEKENEDDDDDHVEEEDDDNDNFTPTTPMSSMTPTTETPPSTPKVYANVTLSNVLSYEPNLKTGWIHAPCTVKDDENMYDNTVVLTTKHTVFRLTSRCFSEKMMFMNLVKLKHRILPSLNQDDDDDDRTQVDNSEEEDDDDSDHDNDDNDKGNDIMTSIDVMTHLQKKAAYQLESIQDLTIKLNIAKESISYYTQELLELEQSMDILVDNINNIQFTSLKRVLDFVNHQLADSITAFHSHRKRVSQLHERVSVHNAFLIGARQRFEQIRSRIKKHAWYPWLYTSLTGFILVVSVLIGYYFLRTTKEE